MPPSKNASEVSKENNDFVPQIDLSASAAELERRAETSSELDPEALKSKISTRFEDFYGDGAGDEEPMYLGGAVAGEADTIDEEPMGYLGGASASEDKPKFQGFFDGAVAEAQDEEPQELQGLFDGEVGPSRAERFFSETTDTAYQRGEQDAAPEAGQEGYLEGQTADEAGYGDTAENYPGQVMDEVYSDQTYEDGFEEPVRRPGDSQFMKGLDNRSDSNYGGADTLDEMFADIDEYGQADPAEATDSVFPEREAFVSTDDGALSSHEASRIIDAISRAPDEPSRINYDHFTEPQEGDYHTGTQMEMKVGPKLWETAYQPASETEAPRSRAPYLLLILLLLVGGVALFWGQIRELVVPSVPVTPNGQPAVAVSRLDKINALKLAEKTGAVNWQATSTKDLSQMLDFAMTDAEFNAAHNAEHKRALEEVKRQLSMAPTIDLNAIQSPEELVAILDFSEEFGANNQNLSMIQELQEVVKRSESYGTLGINETLKPRYRPGGN